LLTIFDIGLYNGADTEYYLESGYDVVAVEANPTLVRRAEVRFERYIREGRLKLLHGAIGPAGDEPVELFLSEDHPGSSSIRSELVASLQPMGSYTVPGIRFRKLLARHGTPHFVKVDIEGADRHCILELTQDTCPAFLSFELGDDCEKLIGHAESIGFDRFKIINQVVFRELAEENNIGDRIRRRLVRELGFLNPKSVKRAGRFFSTGSAGPLPWVSSGSWHSADEALSRWRAVGSLLGRYGLGTTFTPSAQTESM